MNMDLSPVGNDSFELRTASLAKRESPLDVNTLVTGFHRIENPKGVPYPWSPKMTAASHLSPNDFARLPPICLASRGGGFLGSYACWKGEAIPMKAEGKTSFDPMRPLLAKEAEMVRRPKRLHLADWPLP